jgi:hypothetical protein
MGIVTHCPNGHRTKVKDQLAGKRVLCPVCGAKYRVEQPVPAALAGGPELPLGRLIPLDPQMIATLPRALPFGGFRAAQQAAAEPTIDVEAAVPEPIPAAASAAQPLHPILAERADLAWRIAYPGGEPSEPVDAATMQEWLGGGQAEGTELVWRADWAEWIPVRQAFPEFFG